jgi:predicted SAM-dependent methyltransferase
MSRRLHIGGTIKADGWEIFNITPGPAVDHVGDAKDMSRFRDGLFVEVYASHVLEHFDGKGLELALKEWHRILASEGKLYVSVPDLDVLSRLFLQKDKFPPQERIKLIQMMYGGHVDSHDVHNVGFDKDILTALIRQAGYKTCTFVPKFDIGFKDCSTIEFGGVPISLNLIATKDRVESKNPEIPKTDIAKDVFYIMSTARLGFTDNLFSLIGSVSKLGIDGQRFTGVFWEQGMENLLENAIEKGFKYALAIDYDTFYTAYHVMDIYNLMESNPNVGLLIPLQPRRGNTYPMSGKFEDPNGDLVCVSKGPFTDGIQDVDTGHFGLTMLRLSELSKFGKPWFESKTNEKGDWHRGHKDADVNFWIKCKNAGIVAKLAEVWIGHMELKCSFCGPVEENFKTYSLDINEVLEGALPSWTIPKSFKDGQLINNYLPTEKQGVSQ